MSVIVRDSFVSGSFDYNYFQKLRISCCMQVGLGAKPFWATKFKNIFRRKMNLRELNLSFNLCIIWHDIQSNMSIANTQGVTQLVAIVDGSDCIVRTVFKC